MLLITYKAIIHLRKPNDNAPIIANFHVLILNLQTSKIQQCIGVTCKFST